MRKTLRTSLARCAFMRSRPGRRAHHLRRTLPPRLSIVVPPFANIGGDPGQDYFVDGVTESLTTDLSRASGSFVIARNTAFTYKGKPFDAKQIGRELNVRYVLEGSVQRSGDDCASTSSSSTRRPAHISGPSASINPSPTCSKCRTKLRCSGDTSCRNVHGPTR